MSVAEEQQRPTVGEPGELLDQLFAAVDRVLHEEGVQAIDPEVITRMNTLGVKLFGAAREAGADVDPVLPGEAVSATEASMFCSALLKVVNLDLFELSLWRQWGVQL
jgi:hypothetical protein